MSLIILRLRYASRYVQILRERGRERNKGQEPKTKRGKLARRMQHGGSEGGDCMHGRSNALSSFVHHGEIASALSKDAVATWRSRR